MHFVPLISLSVADIKPVSSSAWMVVMFAAQTEYSKTFNEDLKAVTDSTGMENPLHIFNNTDCTFSGGPDTWTQDFFEPGYTSIPGPDGPVSLRIMIRSSQSDRESGRKLFQELRSDSVGVVQHIRSELDVDTVEAMGNLETIPPYTHNGEAYPVGRAILGSSDVKPAMMAFLEAQEVQKPLELDTSWLNVGHVEEFLQFLPVESERKWVMVVDDPEAGLELLQGAQRPGHGAVKAVSRHGRPSDPADKICTPSDTIDQNNIDLNKRETGITDAEIIRLPALYYPGSRKLPRWQCEEKGKSRRGRREVRANAPADANILGESDEVPVSADGAPPAQLERRVASEMVSLWPAIVNSLVLNDAKVLAGNPWVPVIDDKDIFVEAANAAYAKAGFTVEYIDDWYSQHARGGDVHCATNTLREMTGQLRFVLLVNKFNT